MSIIFIFMYHESLSVSHQVGVLGIMPECYSMAVSHAKGLFSFNVDLDFHIIVYFIN